MGIVIYHPPTSALQINVLGRKPQICLQSLEKVIKRKRRVDDRERMKSCEKRQLIDFSRF